MSEEQGEFDRLNGEVDRLKAELAKAQAELQAWTSTCGTRQNHVEDVEKLKAENARLLAPTTAFLRTVLKLQVYNDSELADILIEAKKELARLRAVMEGKV